MMTKSKKFLMLMLTLMVSVAGYAQTEIDGLYYNLDSKTKEAEVTSGEISRDVVEIPSVVTYNGVEYKVTRIGNYAFEGKPSLKKITIPESVTEIGYSAFRCTGITSITIPNSVKNLGDRAFEECYELTSVTISNSIVTISDETFSNCISLTSVTIPNSVTQIFNNAFYNCNNLTSITLPEYIWNIGSEAFCGCEKLTSITIPKYVSCLGYNIFGGCPNLTSLIVESENDNYDSRDNCNAIIETATNTLVEGCKNTVIPNSVTSIGDHAFQYCTGLTSVVIPNSVTTIGEEAFASCSELVLVTLPSSVTTIKEKAFYNINAYHQLNVINLSKTPQQIPDYLYTNCGTLHVLPNCKTAYENKEGWRHFTVIEDAELPVEVITVSTLIDNISAYEQQPYTREFYIAAARSAYDALTKEQQALINNYSILYDAENPHEEFKAEIDGLCYWLDKTAKEAEVIAGQPRYSGDVVIPATVTLEGTDYNVVKINTYAFMDCSYLTSVTIPNSVTSIDENTFHGCTRLTSVTIPNSVTSIGNNAFECCTSLASITLPNSVTSIGHKAFLECTSLASITLPNSIKLIEHETFECCSSLTSVTIPSSVTKIDYYAFYGCNNLTSVINLSEAPQTTQVECFSVYETLHVLPGCKSAYENADTWKNFTIVEDADIFVKVISVYDLIAAIGKVDNTEACKAKITAARSAYEALTKEQQDLVKNLSVLVEAEDAYKQLETSGIADVTTKEESNNGKYLVNGKIMIVKNGKTYNLSGQAE